MARTLVTLSTTSFLLFLAGCSEGSKMTDKADEWGGAGDTGDWTSDSTSGDADADTDTDADADSYTTSDTGTVPTDTDTTDTDTDVDTTTSGCDDARPVTLYVSPDDSNSTSSPVQARLAITDDWNDLRAVPIRTYEFMNYYGFAYSRPEPGALAVDTELSAVADDTWELQIGLTSEARTNDEREPMNLTLSIDTSGSMEGDSIDLVKEACTAMASSLREGDIVSMVRWSSTTTVILDSYAVTGPDDPTLLAAIDALRTDGSTDLSSGLRKAYELAEANYSEDRINRVVLMSDGGANTGMTDEDLIARYSAEEDREGIYLVGVGVGTSSTYSDDLMDTVTDLGRGASVFVSDREEAWKMFGDDGFVRTMDVAWRNVSIELDLPPGFEIVRFSGEEYSGNPHDIEPQHLAPDDSMVFYMTIDTCAPEAVTSESPITVRAIHTDPITLEEHTTTSTSTFGALLGGDTALLAKGAAVYGYAEGLKAWQHAGTTADRHAAIETALDKVTAAEVLNPGDDDLAEIETLLRILE